MKKLSALLLTAAIVAAPILPAATAAPVPAVTAPVDAEALNQSRAVWIDAGTIAWPAAGSADGNSWTLVSSGSAELTTHGGDVVPLQLDESGLTEEQKTRYGWLGDVWTLRLSGVDESRIRQLLTTQLAVVRTRPGGTQEATGLQLSGVLDDIYAAAWDSDLGVTWSDGVPTLRVWAPTAQNVALLRYDGPESRLTERVSAERAADGTWVVHGERDWAGSGYLYEVSVYAPTTRQIELNAVTDPYSVALTTNSTQSVMIDLDDAELQPDTWASTPSPVVRNAAARTIYELHVRDFSIADESLPTHVRGTYEAFTRHGEGRRHLQKLAAAGLNTVHLLPTFDIASIEEDRVAQREPDCDLDAGPDWAEQQACVMSVADQDGFNWGYDPLHFMAPEGSYAIDPERGARVSEFRDMVGALHQDGLQVVLDVVFNHTAASGQSDKSVLDRIVPGYYQRLNARGDVETSTCCANLATENAMAQKLMVDSLVLWARDYRVDGFRFDLMGHSSKSNLLAARAALDELTLENDGVDGSSIYLYGEGWNFGEVANNTRFEQASQGQLGGTGIGTFNDRLRDAVHGGSPGDHSSTFAQGFGTGLSTDPNGDAANGSDGDAAARLALDTDLVKIGLAGNLRSFRFTTSDGTEKRGDEIPFGDGTAAYGDEPDETVNYVDAHDNETLYDILAMKLPAETPMEDRVRMNTLALAISTLSQSPALWHAGTDLLRSKSLDRNSYNSGDWFNAIDWTGETSNYGVGLPPERDNGYRWSAIAPLLRDDMLKPDADTIASATTQAQQLLKLKSASPLFSLGSAALINDKLTFPSGGHDAPPGVVLMSIDDTRGSDVDPELDGILTVFNASATEVTLPVAELAGREFMLSPILRDGDDAALAVASWNTGTATVTVPSRSVAVFIDTQDTSVTAPLSPPEQGVDLILWITVAALAVLLAVAVAIVLAARRGRRTNHPGSSDLS